MDVTAEARSAQINSEGFVTGDDSRRRAVALAAGFLGVVFFLTVVHMVIAVDDRFTTPALPLIGLLAGARLGLLVPRREPEGERVGGVAVLASERRSR